MEIIYNNEYFLQFTDFFLDLAQWSPELWWKICIVFRNIGLYSINKKLQKRLKTKFARFIVLNHGNYRHEFFKLPNQQNHGLFKQIRNSDNKLKTSYFYKNGELDGEYKEYHSCEEKLRVLKYYKNGKEHGEYKEYDKNGNLLINYHKLYGFIHGKYCGYEYSDNVNISCQEHWFYLGKSVQSILEIKPIQYPTIITKFDKEIYVWLVYGATSGDGDDVYYSIDGYSSIIMSLINKTKNLDTYNFYITPTGLRICGLKSNTITFNRLVAQYEKYAIPAINVNDSTNLLALQSIPLCEKSVEYKNEFFLQFQDFFLDLAQWSPELWWKICLVFKNIGLYSLNKKLHVQRRLKKKFARLVVEEKYYCNLEYYVLPCGTKHGEFKKIKKFDNKLSMSCFYKKDKLNGEYKEYYADGENIRFQTYYKNDEEHGEYKEYNNSAKPYSIFEGIKDGELLINYHKLYSFIHGKYLGNKDLNDELYIPDEGFYNFGKRVEYILEIKPLRYPELITKLDKRIYIWLMYSLVHKDEYGDDVYYSIDGGSSYMRLINKAKNIQYYDFYITPTNLKICGSKGNMEFKKVVAQYEEYSIHKK
jgi:antitoxin component YwqK of YwqJK toxin-antitoxin module